MLRLGLTFFLLFFNILWMCFFVYVKNHTVTNRTPLELNIQKDVFNINQIEFHLGSEQQYLQLCKKGQDWHVNLPLKWEANPLTIGDFLHNFALVKPQLSFKLDTGDNLDHYGLSVPFCTLKCSTPLHTYILHFGNNTSVNGKVYVLEMETNKIFVLDASFLNCLLLPLEQWCHPMVFNVQNMQSINFESPIQKVYLSYLNGHWKLKIPQEVVADQQHVEVVCQQILQLEVTHFLSAEEAKPWVEKFTQDQNFYQLTLLTETDSNVLKIFPYNESKHQFVAQRNNEGPLFVFQSTFVERLLTPEDTLRERKLFQWKWSDFSKINYENKLGSFTLQPITSERWEVLHPGSIDGTKRASLYDIRQLVRSLNDLYVEHFVKEPMEFSNADATISLHLQDGRVRHLCFYKKEDGVYLQEDGSGSLYRLTCVDEDLLTKTMEDFQNKTIWHWAKDEKLQKLTLVLKNTGQKFPIDLNKVDVRFLSRLTAHQWVKHAVTFPIFSPNIYELKIETLDDKKTIRRYTLQFSDRVSGTLQAGSYGGERFTFTQDWIDFLFELTHRPVWNRMKSELLP